MFDLLAFDVEGENRHSAAVLLSDQAGLTVDRTLQERHVWRPAGDIDEDARDPLGAVDLVEHGADQAAAVGDGRGVGVEEADEGVDVLGFPGLLKALTMAACWAVGVAGACEARMRRRALSGGREEIRLSIEPAAKAAVCTTVITLAPIELRPLRQRSAARVGTFLLGLGLLLNPQAPLSVLTEACLAIRQARSP